MYRGVPGPTVHFHIFVSYSRIQNGDGTFLKSLFLVVCPSARLFTFQCLSVLHNQVSLLSTMRKRLPGNLHVKLTQIPQAECRPIVLGLVILGEWQTESA